jgi:hypothetical protein
MRVEISGILAVSARYPGVMRTEWVNEAVDNVLAEVDKYVRAEADLIFNRRMELIEASRSHQKGEHNGNA